MTEDKWNIDKPPDEKALEVRRKAFERLEQLRRPIPDLDEKKELEEYWDEKYEEYLNLQ